MTRILPQSGSFEVMKSDDDCILSGQVEIAEKHATPQLCFNCAPPDQSSRGKWLSGKTVYESLSKKGYNYGHKLQLLETTAKHGKLG